MKNIIRKPLKAVLLTGALFAAVTAFSQNVEVTQATTSEGTVSGFGAKSIIIRTESGAQPVHYVSSDITTYVDEEGNPVAVTAVKSGRPVTIYYTKVGDTLVASKVMVRKVIAAPAPAVETTQTTTTAAGTISDFGDRSMVIKTESSAEPVHYTYSKTTTYVDEDGSPVSIKTVKSGLPVTVYYTKVGSTMIASKVIVRKAEVVPAPVIPAPALEERKTTTTTTRTDK